MHTAARQASSSYWRLSMGAALFAVLVASVPLAVTPDERTTAFLVVVALSWLGITLADRDGRSSAALLAGEAVLVGLACGFTDTTPLLAALAVPVFRAGLRGGVAAFAGSLGLELAAFVGASVASRPITTDYAVASVSWVLIALGIGLIGSYHRATTQPVDPLSPHRAAQSLLRELLDLSGDLRASLDAVALGSVVVETVRDELPVTAAGVLVPRDDALTPLTTSPGADGSDDDTMAEVAHRCWRAAAPQVHGQSFAFPLLSDNRVVAVASGVLPSRLDPQDLVLSGQLAELTRRFEHVAVQLDTALLFTRLRDTATADERRRLAREIHDGVAQDIASLGYLVDALAATPANPQQAERLRTLRHRITGVVAEVRRSVQTLRTDAGSSASLGAAVGALARHLSESSGIPLRVTVDEGTARLRPEVESELLRIAQEAMNNAVRHARPTAVDVLVRVSAPSAEVVVRDDGTGLGPGRADSHGLAIMRERAALVDGDLDVAPVFPHGTEVRVRVGAHRDRTSTASPVPASSPASASSPAPDGTVTS